MSLKNTDDYLIPMDDEDLDDTGGWKGPSGGGSRRKKNWHSNAFFQAVGDLFAGFAWYDLILGPLTLLFVVMILFNLDAVLYWFAVMTLKLLNVSIVFLLVVLGLLLLAAFIRGRRDRRDRRDRRRRRGGWF